METYNPDRAISRRFALAIGLTAITLVGEVAGGLWTNSLALLSDAAHVFLDLFALVLSLGALKLASLPPTETRTYGWHRTEVLASLVNGVTVFLIGVGIFYEAWGRVLNPQKVNSLPMFIIAFVGLVMNLLSAYALRSHSRHDLNVKSAFLHVLGDAAASLGVIAGGVIMYLWGLYILDGIISIGIGLVVFVGAFRVLRDSVHILLEGVPRGLKVADVLADIKAVEGVEDIHHLNVWAVCSHIVILSAHVNIRPAFKEKQALVIYNIDQMLIQKFHISHTTLQVECMNCIEGPVFRSLEHSVQTHDHHA
jgi:cobalt-zinc-cadmium efflux system protein